MALDVVTLNQNTTVGKDIGVDNIGGTDYEVVKQAFGVAGDLNLVSASIPLPVTDNATEVSVASIDTKTPTVGQKAMAASSPVVIASDQSALPVTGTFWQATQPVSGTFFQATQPVSAASLPLPALAATSTKQSDGTQKTQVVDGSGNVIGATSNALDVNIKSGNPTSIAATIADGADITEGALADAIVAAGATGSVSAKLRRATQGLEDLKSLIVLAAGTALIGKVGIDQTVDGTTNKVSATQATASNLNAQVVGNIAHDGVDSGNPVKVGQKAVALGANPTAVAAGDRTDWYANTAGIPFVQAGHPNVICFRATYTTAQTDAAIITISTGSKIVVTRCSAMLSAATTVTPSVIIGFGTATTPTTTGVILSHPGIAPGSGVVEGNGAGILGIGADNEDLRITASVPTNGTLDVVISYYTVST